MRHYLLELLAPEEREEFEQKCFPDQRLCEELAFAENELVDGYVRGDLPAAEREHFERRYCKTPVRMARVEIARALRHVASEAESKASTPKISMWRSLVAFPRQWAFPVAVSLLTIAVVGGWLLMRIRNDSAESPNPHPAIASAPKQAEEAPAPGSDILQKSPEIAGLHRNRPAESPSAHASLPTPPVPAEEGRATATNAPQKSFEIAGNKSPDTVKLFLDSDVLRGPGGATPKLVLSTRYSWVDFQMRVDRDSYASYRTVLESVEGHRIVSANGLKSAGVGSGVLVSWRVPLKEIKPGDYIITLSGGASGKGAADVQLQSYTFKAVHE